MVLAWVATDPLEAQLYVWLVMEHDEILLGIFIKTSFASSAESSVALLINFKEAVVSF